MYYKIENKACEVYKRLHEMRTSELQWEKENEQAINEKTGLSFESFLGYSGQQTFNRVTSYSGFAFTEPDKVNPKIWKRDSKASSIFIPNKRTKEGREMEQLIRNGLKGHAFSVVYKNLELEQPMGRVTFPYVEICGDVIVIYLGEFQDLTDTNVIEITKREFNELMDSISKTAN